MVSEPKVLPPLITEVTEIKEAEQAASEIVEVGEDIPGIGGIISPEKKYPT